MYSFIPMNQEMAEEIAYRWKYDGEFSFYDMTEDEEDLAEFLQSDRTGYYTVKKEEEWIGYYCFEESGRGEIEIGLGMKPELTGNGLGLEFFQQGIEFALEQYGPAELFLSVAAFNQRAIKVYQKAGFIPVKTFIQDTNGSSFEFVRMKFNPKGE
ncbi:GNAT family N-acetyltransferase [Rossellomorea vietnamensis]|uniref:GNAT family N-acetyltransferase n=1 Tax=Rossellomorea vietnamensis TaxID=218284 RepID=A0A5D4KB24_9BACI|nr:GNAT family N-acetyltransferase [Rossellomorea vietnamensis]